MIWVRSQDKKMLVEASNFGINDEGYYGSKSTHYTIDCDVHDSTFELGKYSTEEKAFKVLDKLQEALTPRLIIDVDGRIEEKGGRDIVFQMPQDEEVIV